MLSIFQYNIKISTSIHLWLCIVLGWSCWYGLAKPIIASPVPQDVKELPYFIGLDVQLENATDSEIRVAVKEIEIAGSTVFTDAELAALVAPFINKQLNFTELLAIRAAVTNLYTTKGYLTSGAYLPPQDISDGIIHVQIIEGKLEDIEIRGLTRLQDSYVRDRLAQAAQGPININKIEADLQLLRQDPLLSQVSAELTEGSSLGQNILAIDLVEAPPFSSSLSINNYQSPSVGSFGGGVNLSYSNLLGIGDRLTGGGGLTRGTRDFSVQYEIPVNKRDVRLAFSYDRGRNEVIEEPFSPLDIIGNSETYAFKFHLPIERTSTEEFSLGFSTELRRSQTYLLKDEPFSFTVGPEDGESKLTVLRFSQDWVQRRPSSVFAARSQFSIGLGIFDATINDTGTDGRFFSWLGQFQWIQALNEEKDALLVGRVGMQLTGDSLLPIEQLSIGGFNTVRGYRTNQRVGDSGVLGSLELRLPVARSDRWGLLQVAPFVDVGTVWSNNNGGTTLLGTGLGLRWQIGSLSANLDWGIPLTSVGDRGNSLQDRGIVFSINYSPFQF